MAGDDSTVATRAAARWRRSRLAVGLLAAALVVAVLGVLALPGTGGGALAPDNAGPEGARALAEVLGAQGVEVRRVARVADAVRAAGPASTLLVVQPDLLPPDLVTDLAGTGADLVLVAPDATTLAAAGAGIVPAGTSDDSVSAPGCDVPAAVAAGDASSGGRLYRAAAGAAGTQVCYASAGAGSYAVWRGEGGGVTVVGQAQVLTNAHLADEGNAALALRTLGASPRLVWLMASPLEGPTGGSQDPTTLLPRWVGWVALQLALVTLLAIAWRARRLGRLVPEPLPVVVRAGETATGRASLYRRAGARDRAAAVLRAASLGRLATRLGLGSAATAGEVVEGATHATGRPATDVDHLLRGPPPTDDRALTALADALDTLEEDVSRP